MRAEPEVSKREYLEIGPPRQELEEFLMVVRDGGESKKEERKKKVDDNEEFVDDPNVPPLE